METLTLRQRAKGRTLPAILISVIYILADVAFGYMIFPYIAFRRHNGSNILRSSWSFPSQLFLSF